jgi:hypothetical protein
MDLLLSICAGLGLAAACGFRVFVPLLVAAVAARTGYLHPSAGMDWIGSTPALVAFATATVLEVVAYYVPWLDHLLDTVASPAAVVAGTVAAAGAFGDIHPAVKWSAALVAGGGLAAAIQGTTVLARGLSGATTAGLGNPAVSTGENVGAIVLAILAVVLPILAAILAVGVVLYLLRWILRRRRARREDVPAE